MIVSEETVRRDIDEIVITRDERRRIQKLDQRDFKEYLVKFYHKAFIDGAEACQYVIEHAEGDTEEVKVDWEDVLKLISEVKGIGKKLLAEIDEKLREAY